MSSSTLIEVFGHIVFSFTRGVTEHYNPEEPEFTTESFGFDPLQSTGREWNYLPVDELIYQEYSDREATSWDYLGSSSLDIRVIDACSPLRDENEETQEDQQDEDKAMAWKREYSFRKATSRNEIRVIDARSPEETDETQDDQQDEIRAMAWKRLRPSALRTVCKSMYIGALISLLTATIIGSVFMMISYVSYKTELNCQFHPKKLIPIQMQWFRSISGMITCAFLYVWYFVTMLFLFRPYQLMEVKKKLFLVCCLFYCLDSLYRFALQVLGISHSKISTLQKIPLNVLFFISVCWQVYIIMNHLRMRRTRKQQVTFFLQMILPGCSSCILAWITAYVIYPAYNKQHKEGKLLIAIFAPLIGVVIKAISRISVQQLRNISHPGYSNALLVPLYFGSAVVFRVLQADLANVESIALLGIIHGAAEVIERSAMVVIDHICHLIWKRTPAPWGSFRTPRRERLMADIAIMSMLYESAAIVSVNGFLYMYQFIYLQNDSLLKLLQTFAIHTSVQLVIEWFFTSVSLAIGTRYQNMAVMAVWRRRWKRHTIVAIVNVVPLALWTAVNLLTVVHGRFKESVNQPCKMPFT
ncbi:uncharacterized protein LOC144633018 [Oculina patagonica]